MKDLIGVTDERQHRHLRRPPVRPQGGLPQLPQASDRGQLADGGQPEQRQLHHRPRRGLVLLRQPGPGGPASSTGTGHAFTYGYDCTGDVAWLEETPASQAPSTVSPRAESGCTVRAPTTPAASGTTFVTTSYTYSSGGSGNLLTSQATSAVMHQANSLLEFDSLTYDYSNDLTQLEGRQARPRPPTPTPTTATAAGDLRAGDVRVTHRLLLHQLEHRHLPDMLQPYCSHNTADQMGIDAMPEPVGSTAQRVLGSGEALLVGERDVDVGGTRRARGDELRDDELQQLRGPYGDLKDRDLRLQLGDYLDVDTNEPTCINPSGTTCTGPSSSQPNAETYTYNAHGLRMTEEAWSSSTSSTATSEFA